MPGCSGYIGDCTTQFVEIVKKKLGSLLHNQDSMESKRFVFVVQVMVSSVSAVPGEMIQFDEHIFQMGWFNHQIETTYTYRLGHAVQPWFTKWETNQH